MWCNLVTLAATVTAAPALDDKALTEALATLAKDPPIAAVQEAALDYFAVEEGDIMGYRALARLRGLVPSLTGAVSLDDNKETRLSTDQNVWAQPFDPADPQVTDAVSGVGRTFAASATWDLSTLLFSPSELESYALVGIQEDLLKEVTRLYYTRQHNLLALLLDPPSDLRAKAALILRIRESEAMLDALTGGAFTKLKQGP